MSNLTELVPPLELCKLIPAGEFADSALAWFSNYHFGGFYVEKRDLAAALSDNGELHPAPTTDEILAECKDIHRVLNPTLWWQGTWKADCAINKSDKLIEECLEDADFNDLDIVETQDDNAATSSLRLWLKLKGVEYEQKQS